MNNFRKSLATAMALSVIASQTTLPIHAVKQASSSEAISPMSVTAVTETATNDNSLSTMAIAEYTFTVNVDGEFRGSYPMTVSDTETGQFTFTTNVDFPYSNIEAITVHRKTGYWTWENVTGLNGSEAGYTFQNGTPDDESDDTFVAVAFGGGTGGADGEALNNLMTTIYNPGADITINVQTAGFVTEFNSLSISNDKNLSLNNSSSEHQVANRGEFDFSWIADSGYEVSEVTISEQSGAQHTLTLAEKLLILDNPGTTTGDSTNIAFSADSSKGYYYIMITDMLQDLQIHARAHRSEVDLTGSGTNVSSTSSTIKWEGSSSILITPSSGYSITGLTANGSPITIGTKSTVSGVVIEAVRNSDGTITVTGTSEGDYDFSDVHIVATAAKDMHTVDVTTDSNVTSSIYGASLNSGDALEMTFTPDSGYEVSYISVTYNGATGTIPVTGGYGIVGGKTFNTSITTGDTVKLTMQGIASDMQISVTSVKKDVESHNITVTTDGNMTTNGSSVTLADGETHSLVLTPKSGYEIDKVEINYLNQYRTLSLTGSIETIDGKSFYARTQADNSVLVTIPAIADDLIVNATAKTTSSGSTGTESNGTLDRYTLSVTTDSYLDASKSSTSVTSGGSEYFTLYPNTGYSVKAIYVSYGTQSGTLALDGSSLTLGDCTFIASAQSNGNILVSAYGISNNVTFNATSQASASQTHQMTISTDTNMRSSMETGFVTAGSAQSITLTPNADYMVDSVKVTYDGKSGTLTESADTLTLSGTTFTLTTSTTGSAILSISSVDDDISVEATSLYGESNVSYVLGVTTDSRITSNITSETVLENATRVVTFTPDYKFGVASIDLTYNDETKSMTLDGEAFRVGGKVFTATRLADGVIQVEVPSMEGDVSLSAKSGTAQYLIEVDSGDFADSIYDGEQFLGLYEKMTISFEPSMVAVMEGIKVTTSRGAATADFSAEKIAVDGYYYNIGIDSDGNGWIEIDSTDRDLKIEPIIYQTALLATVIDEAGVTHDRDYKEAVDEGDGYTITFTPDAGYYIDNIELKYGTNTYELDVVGEDDYVYLNSANNPITISDNGEVTIQILSVEENMTFTVDARKYDGYTITRSQDFYTLISFTGTAPFDNDDTTTITVTPVDGYVVNTVTLSDDTDTVTFYTDDESILFNGTRYVIRWNNDYSCSLTLDGLDSNLAVSSTGKKYSSEQSVIARHEAYLSGYGNGMFGINSSMTRAEAVTMMTTLFFPNYDFTNTSGNQHFVDVTGNIWYSNPVNFAASQGLLQVIIRQNGSFHPDSAITRAELVALMCAYSKMSIPAETHEQVFEDMNVTHWAYQYIHTAEQNGWVDGYEDQTFRPENQITRAEVTTMMNRVLGRRADPNATFVTQFSDVSSSHWAYLDIMEATNSHNVVGYEGDGEIWA